MEGHFYIKTNGLGSIDAQILYVDKSGKKIELTNICKVEIEMAPDQFTEIKLTGYGKLDIKGVKTSRSYEQICPNCKKEMRTKMIIKGKKGTQGDGYLQ